jgi:hypothetical protein
MAMVTEKSSRKTSPPQKAPRKPAARKTATRKPVPRSTIPGYKKPREFLVDGKGQRTAVILPMADWEELLGDLHDIAVIAARRNEPRESLADVKRRLQANGLLPR